LVFPDRSGGNDVAADNVPAQFDLAGRVAVVTGANRGIGLGIARGLARAGADVAIWARDVERNAAAAAQLDGLGGKVVAIRCDVGDPDQVEAAAAETATRLGPVSTCFAVAGINRQSAFGSTSLAEFREVMRTNLEGTFLTFQAVVPAMIERGGGSLVAVSSISAACGQPRSCHYAASKAGIGALVKSLAVELARNRVRANLIVPGWVETDMIAPFLGNEKFVDAVIRRIPQRRWGQSEDFAGPAVFLASDASSYMTGAELTVDGGYTLF
jgi:NAD(P)-dependent dehydrogenase (short-subunit alcohol dehydrogenase family)